MTAPLWRRLSGLAEAGEWLAHCQSADPFLHPGFLQALETSGAVGPGTAWQPCHLLFEHAGQPRALLPLYRKRDSRGEYVFDQAWAHAYERHGLPYYPKLLTAIPFSPVPGPRLLLAPGENPAFWQQQALHAVQMECREQGLSGWHGLFVDEDWLTAAQTQGFAVREGCRFHWSNPGHHSFEDFLGTLTSKKRKDLRRERRLLQEAGVVCRRLRGPEISEADWDFFWHCYQQTYFEHGQRPYLNREFFRQLASSQPQQLMLVIAADSDGPMASALFLHNDSSLYGRYWGCLRRADGLHFEVCYYQGMEFCMEQGLRDFDPGTQGEHKLLRGFAPVITYSLHWLAEPGFQDAIQRFTQEESVAVRRYAAEAASALPFKTMAQTE